MVYNLQKKKKNARRKKNSFAKVTLLDKNLNKYRVALPFIYKKKSKHFLKATDV